MNSVMNDFEGHPNGAGQKIGDVKEVRINSQFSCMVAAQRELGSLLQLLEERLQVKAMQLIGDLPASAEELAEPVRDEKEPVKSRPPSYVEESQNVTSSCFRCANRILRLVEMI